MKLLAKYRSPWKTQLSESSPKLTAKLRINSSIRVNLSNLTNIDGNSLILRAFHLNHSKSKWVRILTKYPWKHELTEDELLSKAK